MSRTLGLGHALLEVQPCQYGYSKVTCRGPEVDQSEPYLAFLGASETVGPFLTRPYPTLLSETLGLGCANLGVKNAGPDVYINEPEILRVASGAQAVILELMGATNLSNAFYKVHPRRNDRFVRAYNALAEHAFEIDLTEVHFTGHLLHEVAGAAPDLHETIVEELRATWVERVSMLIDAIGAPVHLLCLTDAKGNPSHAPLVDMTMADAVGRKAASLTCVKPSREALANGTREMFFSPPEAPIAVQMLSAAAHREVSTAMEAVLSAKEEQAHAG